MITTNELEKAKILDESIKYLKDLLRKIELLDLYPDVNIKEARLSCHDGRIGEFYLDKYMLNAVFGFAGITATIKKECKEKILKYQNEFNQIIKEDK